MEITLGLGGEKIFCIFFRNHLIPKSAIRSYLGDLDQAVVNQINSIQGTEWRVYQNGFIAEVLHCMNKTERAFRLIVIRCPVQGFLFDDAEEQKDKYTVITTNRTERAEEVVKWYNHRGGSMENRTKNLKIGFGMERMPCGKFEASAVFFRIGVLAYNLERLFALNTLDSSWHKHQIQTLRWKLYGTASKVVFNGGAIWLKVTGSLWRLFPNIRSRTG